MPLYPPAPASASLIVFKLPQHRATHVVFGLAHLDSSLQLQVEVHLHCPCRRANPLSHCGLHDSYEPAPPRAYFHPQGVPQQTPHGAPLRRGACPRAMLHPHCTPLVNTQQRVVTTHTYTIHIASHTGHPNLFTSLTISYSLSSLLLSSHALLRRPRPLPLLWLPLPII